jgi:pimeloyl-ACP methyl ester carboxylesterase
MTSSVATVPHIAYRNATVDGLNIFYREAGPADAPTLVLLHGFPSSSHMFRNLIPVLSEKYHIIAPDYPGFGYSDAPSADTFEYTFDHLADIVDHFLEHKGITKYSIYIQDYGSPVGFRLATRHPERIQTIISQNGNAYEEGLSNRQGTNIFRVPETRKASAQMRGHSIS